MRGRRPSSSFLLLGLVLVRKLGLVSREEMASSGPEHAGGFEQVGLAIGRKGQHAGLLSLGLVGMHGPDGLCEPGLAKMGLDLGLNWANECFEFGPWA